MFHARCLLVVAFGASAAFAGGGKEEMKAFDGVWLAKSAELAGNKTPEASLGAFTLKMKDGNYTVGNDHGVVTVDPSKTPKAMDIKGQDGPNKGKTFLCIYELDGDKLKICYDLSGKARPEKFETKPKTKLFLVEYEREKK